MQHSRSWDLLVPQVGKVKGVRQSGDAEREGLINDGDGKASAKRSQRMSKKSKGNCAGERASRASIRNVAARCQR